MRFGTLIFYIVWPLVWFYAPLRVRVRVYMTYDNTHVLCVKNWFGPGVWQLPGGGMKVGETVLETAQREVLEELGIVLQTKQCTQITREPVIVRQFGLLLRQHVIHAHISKTVDITKSKELTEAQWLVAEECRVAPEVLVAKKYT